jgi:hypothetical protein
MQQYPWIPACSLTTCLFSGPSRYQKMS